MLSLVPIIHACHYVFGLPNRNDGSFGYYFQQTVCHHSCYFDDKVLLGIQSRHFEIDPDQVIRIGRHNKFSSLISRWAFYITLTGVPVLYWLFSGAGEIATYPRILKWTL